MKNHFYQVPDKIMSRRDISATDKLLYGVIKRLKVCFASNKKLAEIMGCSEITIKRSLKHLKEVGLIRQLPNQGKRTCYEIWYQNDTNNGIKMIPISYQNDISNGIKMIPDNRDLIREDNKRVSERDTHALDMYLEKVRKFQSLWSLSIGASPTILNQLSSVLSPQALANYLDFVLDEANWDEIGKIMEVAENEDRNIDYFLADNIGRLRNINNKKSP